MFGERVARRVDEKDKAKPDRRKREAGGGCNRERGEAIEIVARACARKNFSSSAFDRRMVDEVLHAAPRWLISR